MEGPQTRRITLPPGTNCTKRLPVFMYACSLWFYCLPSLIIRQMWSLTSSCFVLRLSLTFQQTINIWSWECFPKCSLRSAVFPVHYQHFLSLAGSLDVIQTDGHWSAIDIDRDSKVIIILPRGERSLPGLLSASPSTLPSSESSCHRWPSGRQAPSKWGWYGDVSKSQQEMPVMVRDFW